METRIIKPILILTLIVIMTGCTQKSEYVELPLPYSRAAQSKYKSFDTRSEYVTMSDATKIAIDIFLPTQGDNQSRFPVILSYTPYQRSRIDRETGKMSDLSSGRLSRLLLSQGYALVCADIRGTGASTGWLLDFMPEIWSDGKELVDWIAKQEWSDGNVGMRGGSYLGWSQTATASQMPKALKCIMPAVIPLEGYTGEVYPGGIYLDGFMKSWSSYMYYTTRNYYLPEVKVTTKPVIDEDKDGDLLDEIPLDLNGDGSFLDEGFPPTYSDGMNREHIYYQMTLMHHKKNYDYTEWTNDIYFYDGKSPLGYRVDELGPTAHMYGIMESGIPIYNVGGWFDGFTRGSFELYATLKQSNPSKLIIGPGYHDYAGGPFWEFFGYTEGQARKIFEIEHLRFFDYHLKGINNGIMKEAPILLYVMNGKGWRYEHEWPLKRQQLKKYFLNSGNYLKNVPGIRGKENYTADYSHRSLYGKNKGNRWLGIAALEPDSLPYRNDIESKTIFFETDFLGRDIEVTGHPMVKLDISSSAAYGDIFIYLNDVDENGNVILVTEGQLRAGFANLYNNDDMIQTHSGIDVLPELPWHGFKSDQYIDKIFAGGKIVNLLIDFHPTSWIFKKGHKIRLSIACSDHPTFRLHPKLSPKNDPDDSANIIPTITVHFGADHASYIELPVIPDKP